MFVTMPHPSGTHLGKASPTSATGTKRLQGGARLGACLGWASIGNLTPAAGERSGPRRKKVKGQKRRTS